MTVVADAVRAPGWSPGGSPTPEGDARRRTLTQPVMCMLAVGFLAFVLIALVSHHLASDSYFDLYGGRFIAHHGIPRHEPFTLEAHGRPWLDQQWLAQLLTYAVWTAGGYAAFVLMSAGLVAAAFALHVRLLLRVGVPAQKALPWTLLALVACLNNTLPRAQSFAYPLFVAVVGTVVVDSTRRRWEPRLLWLVPLLLAWANLHGSALLGAAIVAGYAGLRVVAAVRRRDRWSATGYSSLAVLSCASVFATPYGFATWAYYRSVLANPALTRDVTEWGHPSLHDRISLGYFVTVAVVVITVAAVAVRRHRRPPTIPALLVTALLAMSARSIRHEIWFILAGTMLAALVARHSTGASAKLRWPVLALTVAIAASTLTSLLVQPRSAFEDGVSRSVLAAAVGQLSARPGTTVLADETNAGALLWMRPSVAGRVALDIRFEQYRPRLLHSYMDFLHGGSAAPAFAARYGVVLIGTVGHERAVAALRHRGWHIVARDRTELLLVPSESR